MLRATTGQGQSVIISSDPERALELHPSSFILHPSALQGVRALARDDLYATVGAGTPLAALQAELATAGVWVPAVAPSPAATVGGLVSANCNGPLRMRYGGWRDLVLAATVALPDGRLIRAGRPVVKNVAGYDLARLFVGAHGTLGLICELTLKLAPLPRARASLLLPVPTVEAGLALGSRLLPGCLVASALLLCDRGSLALPGLATPYALVYSAEGLAADVSAELAGVWTSASAAGAEPPVELEAGGSALWAAWYGAAMAGDTPLVRLGVAPSALPGLVRELAPQVPAGGLVADLASGLLYLRGLGAVGVAYEAAARRDGYGVALAGPPARGPERWGYMPQALDLMRALKARWNPGDRLNPGGSLV